MNGEKPGWQAVKGEATGVSGGKWRAAVPTTLLPSLSGDHSLRLPSAILPARSLLMLWALRNGCEGLFLAGSPGVRRHKGSPFKGGMLRTIPRTGGSSDAVTSCPWLLPPEATQPWQPKGFRSSLSTEVQEEAPAGDRRKEQPHPKPARAEIEHLPPPLRRAA